MVNKELLKKVKQVKERMAKLGITPADYEPTNVKVKPEEAVWLLRGTVFFPEWWDPKELENMDEEDLMWLEDAEEEVDPLIRPILKDLIEAGFITTYSCQGGPGHVWSTAVIGLAGSSKDIQPYLAEIDEIIKKHTNLPYKVTDALGEATLVFEGPLQEKKGGDEHETSKAQ
jgi:hypothetical protein